jgi:anti-sigma regulatory factor (Ser/Thr protein kinase)
MGVTAAKWSRQAEFAPAAASVAQARSFISETLSDDAAAKGLVEDIRLVCSELATNAVRHASTPFLVTLSRFSGHVRLDVQDASDVSPPMVPPSTGPSVAVHLLGDDGRGLVLVAALSNRWGVQPGADGGKSVWAAFDLG